MVADANTELAAALGNVALADAEADEWLVLVISAILQPIPLAAVRVVVAPDSGFVKVKKIRELMALRKYQHSDEGLPHDPIDELAKRSNELRERRNLALHSFYGSDDGDEIPRFRSRSDQTPATSVAELDHLAADIRATNDQWRAVVQQLEHQTGASRARMDEAYQLLEDASELMSIRRASQRTRDVMQREGDDVRVALKGFGAWRPLTEDEQPADDERVAVIGAHSVRVELSDGQVLEGFDSGWRNITEIAQAHDPEIERASIRRVNNGVRFSQKGGTPLAIESIEDTLASRVFRIPMKLTDALPAYVKELKGFGPAPEDT